MGGFPRSEVGGLSMPRLICGSNCFYGCSHTSKARDRTLQEMFDTPSKVAKVAEVFARHGCNAYMSDPDEFTSQVLQEVEQRVGVEMLWIATPLTETASADADDQWKRAVEKTKRLGARFCFPHGDMTDSLLDRVSRRLTPRLRNCLRFVSEMGMIPGLSTHSPESIIYTDNDPEAEVATYLQPYNAAGFLCQVETDWIHHIIENAHRPVIAIKPLAAGRLLPPTGLAFVWNTLRDCDMVTIGTMSSYEAEECIELSLSVLENRYPNVELQRTRSKRRLTTAGRGGGNHGPAERS
jgi:hypothetical protein